MVLSLKESGMSPCSRLLLAVAVSSVAVPVAATAQSGDEAGVRKLVADFTASLDHADAAAYAALHAENVYVIDLGISIKGRQALLEKFKSDVTGPFKGMKFTSHKVDYVRFVTPTLAYAGSTWEVTIPGGAAPLKGVASFLATKQGGRWIFEGWHAAASQP
jgi:uncharacterized protein (TIGR02246 family)